MDKTCEERLTRRELITAINGLTSLKQLALDWRYYTAHPDLTILAQLKVVAFRSYSVGTFVRSLEQYATDNTDLQVHLFSDDIEALSQPLHSRIVHFGHFDDDWLDLLDDWTRLCSQFRSLTSLKICLFQLTEVGPLFTALSQLHQLVRLELVLYPVSDEEGEEDEEEDEEELPPAPRPLAQINSLKALELYLIISSHSEIEWLNLPWTMPNLQTINICGFSCASCNVVSDDWRNSTLSLLNSPSALPCFQSSLFTLHSGVPLNRFILKFFGRKTISAERLLLQSASEPPSDHYPKTMPPLLQISDLSWIAIFQEFTPNEQMVASKMSLRCAGLVRAANREVKSLIIIDKDDEDPIDFGKIKQRTHRFSLASNPAIQSLMDIPGEPSFPDYPVTVSARLSKWHCLQIDSKEQIDTATTEQIVYIFSAVTDLKFITSYSTRKRHYLAPLLQHPKWQCQLTHFMAHTTMWFDGQQSHELIAAINGLTALQCLALEWYTHIFLPDLTILAQLKVVALQSDNLRAFVRSLERYATDNADLQVHLFSHDIDGLLSLSQPLHSRIVRFGSIDLLCFGDRVPLLCSQFRSLTSLFIWNITVTEIVPLFTVLSQLHQLVHLWFRVRLRSGEEFPPEARPLAQLNTVRALELNLTISAHSEVQWLNLPVTMPNLQTIYIEGFYCSSCNVYIGRYINQDSLPLNSSKALNCLQSSLFKLHCGVPLNRLILRLDKEFVSAEKLLLLQSLTTDQLCILLNTCVQWQDMCSVFPSCFAHIASSTSVDSTDHHPKTMPPRRPLPDLVLITVFKMLTPNEQMVAREMSLRCAVLVRAANRTVKTLVITDRNIENPGVLGGIKVNINYYSLASKPAMRPLMDIPGEPSFPHYPMTTHLSKWHCLKIDSARQIDTATIEQITTIFSAVTDLKFMIVLQKEHKHLVALLQHPNWQCQLTSLMVDETWGMSDQQGCELISAINDLTALKQLALDWRNYTDLPDLTILGQLKVVAFRSDRVGTFVRSLERHATDNDDLQVHLFSDDIEGLLSLSQPLHSRIVHFELDDDWLDLFDATRLCNQFLSLTSLDISLIQLTDIGPLFTDLSQLHQLVNLVLVVDPESDEEGEEDEEEDEEEIPPEPRPLAQMNSLRSLELCLKIESHSEIEWLNLPETMPDLKTIYIWRFNCRGCDVLIDRYNGDSSDLHSSKALNCLQSSLFKLHGGVPMNRLILRSDKEFVSAEKLLLLQSPTTDQLSVDSVASSDLHPKTMPPLLPISDLSWIAIFQEFTPNDQMKASKMSPRCAVLVRAANLKVKTLVITDLNIENPSDLDNIQNQINYYSLASKPAMRPLMDIPGEPSFPHYPMTTHLCKWHCLKIDSTRQIDTATIEQITTIFSAVTDLKFMTDFQKDERRLVALLQQPNWQCQLTNLMVGVAWCVYGPVACQLITAINGLTSLKQLALDCRYYTAHPDLTILAQLKVVAFRSYRVGTFVRSLERHAADNADLQVHLFSDDIKGLLSLSQPLHRRIVYFELDVRFLDLSDATRLCSQFRFLTSLIMGVIPFTEIGPLFAALSQLHQLVHLELVVDQESDEEGEEDEEEDEEKLPPARPLAQLNTLRALELYLNIESHSEIKWLNLPVTMPNLQTIYIQGFCCVSCNVKFHGMNEDEDLSLNSPGHCLKIDSKGQIDKATIEKITTIYSAVTDLKFITYSSIHFKTLVALLHPTWQRQLTNLMVGASWCVDGPVACQLFTAINGLPALQYLAFDFFSTERDLPDLSIFSQLKAVAIKSICLHAWIWRSLERHATENADLQVHLHSNDAEALFNLSQPLHNRIVRLEESGYFLYYSSALRLCNQFRSLTSLSIQKYTWHSSEMGPLFTALSQLHQLVHCIGWYILKDEVLSARPLTPLKSLRALTLYLTITAHSQVQWLNLPVTMPNLQSIHMGTFSCGSCNVYPNWNSLDSPSGLSCLASSHLHSSLRCPA
ncbi:hypothetical protein TYRP_012892 [Tyrophagus putrescentiae]|nr:hypothetical protein TYRP_012892 [Tyrophagus putrescentiae]